MRRMLLVLAVAVTLVMIAAALPALADTGGTPNNNAGPNPCFGFTTAQSSHKGVTPSQFPEGEFANTGQWQQFQHNIGTVGPNCEIK